MPEAHFALGLIYYYGDRDYERALQELTIALRGLPNDSTVYNSIGAIKRRQGKWEEAIASQAKAASLNPNDATAWSDLASNVRSFA